MSCVTGETWLWRALQTTRIPPPRLTASRRRRIGLSCHLRMITAGWRVSRASGMRRYRRQLGTCSTAAPTARAICCGNPAVHTCRIQNVAPSHCLLSCWRADGRGSDLGGRVYELRTEMSRCTMPRHNREGGGHGAGRERFRLPCGDSETAKT
jgi:hypothetical protein